MTAEGQRRYAARHPERWRAIHNEARAKWQRLNRHKHNAHNRVRRAIQSGLLVRPEACEECGKACRPEAAHADYDRPLEVRWLCRQCHARFDKRS